ncbi:MAG: hypothetical protein ACREGB_04640 [Candidatus Saccharimonadales bacterium]
MINLRTKQHAIIIGGLSLLVVIGIIAGGLWLTHRQTGPTSAGSGHVVAIHELGIQITVPDSIKDLRYVVNAVPLDNGRLATIAGFSTSILTKRDPGCTPQDAPLGSLEKVLGQYPSSDPTAVATYGHLVKQFPTFFITVDVPQSVCSTNHTTQVMANQARHDFLAAQSSIQQLH